MTLIPTNSHAETQLEKTAELFKALADASRIRILSLLAFKGWTCNCEIEAVTGYGNSKISRHLSALKQAGLVTSRREGTWIFYALREPSDEVHSEIHRIIELAVTSLPLLTDDRTSMKEKIKSISPPVDLN